MWWLETENITGNYSVAEKVVRRLTSIARTKANELRPSQLRPVPPVVDEDGTVVGEGDLLSGVTLLLRHLEPPPDG